MQAFSRTKMPNWLSPVVLAMVSTVVMLGGESSAQWLRYDRLALANGEYWRLLSGHIVHLGWPHLMLNLAGLFLLHILVGTALNRMQWLLLIVVSALSISAGLWLFDPQLRWYVGLSGVLHAMLLGGALLLTLSGNREGIYLLLLTLAKLLWEQLVGPMPGSEETAGGKVIVNAHLYGAVAGGFYCFGFLLWRRFKATG